MNEVDMIKIAEEFLANKKINFTKPIRMGMLKGCQQEIIFTDPLVLDPKVAVVDPEDIRVWVNKLNGEVTLIEQM